jgi:hypothetical protein
LWRETGAMIFDFLDGHFCVRVLVGEPRKKGPDWAIGTNLLSSWEMKTR